MSKSVDVEMTGPGERNRVNVDGYGVDYSFRPEHDPERTMPVVTLYVKQYRKIGASPERVHTILMTVTPDEAEELAHTLIVQAANARADRDAIVAAREGAAREAALR